MVHHNVCPQRSEYCFKEQCSITSCKYFSEQTERRCLALDVRFSSGEKTTDAELKMYKFPDLSSQKIAALRKNAVGRAENIIRLYVLIQRIELERRVWQYVPSPILDTILARKPLRITKLGFEPWMLFYLCDRNYVVKHTGVEPHELLWMKEVEYQTLANIIRSSNHE